MARRAVLIRILGLAALLAGSSGCLSKLTYVSGELKDVQPGEYQRPASPQPVELVFEFKDDGHTNDFGTSKFAPVVADAVRDSGLFSRITNEPVADGALLSITLDYTGGTSAGENFGNSVVTILSIGLVGAQQTAHFVCTADFQASANAEHLTHVVHHSIYHSIGAKSVPPGAVKVSDMPVAMQIMTRQAVANALKDLSADAKFPK